MPEPGGAVGTGGEKAAAAPRGGQKNRNCAAAAISLVSRRDHADRGAGAHGLQLDRHPGAADGTAGLQRIDENLGRLIKWLDDKELRENTVVIFTSDNGGWVQAQRTSLSAATRVTC